MLKINMEYRKGILFVRLRGNLTRYTYQCLEQYLLPVIENHGIKYLVYNLEAITIIDGYGRASLKKGVAAAKRNQGVGALCNAKTTLKNEFKVFEDELAALFELQI